MEPSHPTAGWETVGGKLFRKSQLYTAVFDQDLELDNYIVAGAPYGGALGAFAAPSVLRRGASGCSLDGRSLMASGHVLASCRLTVRGGCWNITSNHDQRYTEMPQRSRYPKRPSHPSPA